jgi:multidrug efflux pump
LKQCPDFQLNPSKLQDIYVRSATGSAIPLSTFAHFESGTAALAVNHQGQFPVVTISFNLAPNSSLGEATSAIEKVQKDLNMPASVVATFQGTAQAFKASLTNEPLLILAAIITVYIVLGVLYESYIHPLTILSTLPSAGVGAILALLIFHEQLTVVAIIGIILLIGIVKKNAIMMIDFALDAERNEGKSSSEGDLPSMFAAFPANHDDDNGSAAWCAAAGLLDRELVPSCAVLWESHWWVAYYLVSC